MNDELNKYKRQNILLKRKLKEVIKDKENIEEIVKSNDYDDLKTPDFYQNAINKINNIKNTTQVEIAKENSKKQKIYLLSLLLLISLSIVIAVSASIFLIKSGYYLFAFGVILIDLIVVLSVFKNKDKNGENIFNTIKNKDKYIYLSAFTVSIILLSYVFRFFEVSILLALSIPFIFNYIAKLSYKNSIIKMINSNLLLNEVYKEAGVDFEEFEKVKTYDEIIEDKKELKKSKKLLKKQKRIENKKNNKKGWFF